jgi:hypothetical protein
MPRFRRRPKRSPKAKGPQAALVLLDQLALPDYRYFHSARADFLRRLDRKAEARDAYARALELTLTEPEGDHGPAAADRRQPGTRAAHGDALADGEAAGVGAGTDHDGVSPLLAAATPSAGCRYAQPRAQTVTCLACAVAAPPNPVAMNATATAAPGIHRCRMTCPLRQSSVIGRATPCRAVLAIR